MIKINKQKHTHIYGYIKLNRPYVRTYKTYNNILKPQLGSTNIHNIKYNIRVYVNKS